MTEEAWQGLAWIRGALLMAPEDALPGICRALHGEQAEKLSEDLQRIFMKLRIGQLEAAFQSLLGMKARGEFAITDALEQGQYRAATIQADGAAAIFAQTDGQEFPMPPFQQEGDAEGEHGAGESLAGDREIEGIDGDAL